MASRSGMRVVLALALLVAGAACSGDDDDASPVTTTNTTAPPQLDDTSRELASRLEAGRTQEYHAVYRLAQDNGPRVRIEVWSAPPKSRYDSGPDGTPATSRVHIDGEKTVTCTRASGSAAWSCEPSTGSDADIVGDLAKQVAGLTIVSREDKVGRRSARCYTYGEGIQTTDLCVDEDGILLRLHRGPATYEIVSLDENVPARVFEAPK